LNFPGAESQREEAVGWFKSEYEMFWPWAPKGLKEPSVHSRGEPVTRQPAAGPRRVVSLGSFFSPTQAQPDSDPAPPLDLETEAALARVGAIRSDGS
jgi:hypothetical protein